MPATAKAFRWKGRKNNRFYYSIRACNNIMNTTDSGNTKTSSGRNKALYKEIAEQVRKGRHVKLYDCKPLTDPRSPLPMKEILFNSSSPQIQKYL